MCVGVWICLLVCVCAMIVMLVGCAMMRAHKTVVMPSKHFIARERTVVCLTVQYCEV